MAEPPTAVVFRKWRDTGDVIALFPEIAGDRAGRLCSSYMHVGQHGAADTGIVRKLTVPAKPEEYAELARELQAAPYHYQLRIARRVTPQMRMARLADAAT